MTNKTLTKTQAKQLLKKSGLSIKLLAEYQEIQPRAVSERWKNGVLSIKDSLAVLGFIAMHDTDYQTLQNHRDDATLRARLQQLRENH